MPGMKETLNYKRFLPFQSGGRGEEILHELTHGHSFQPCHIVKHREDDSDALLGETGCRVGFEFFHEQRNAFSSAATVANRIFHCDFLRSAAVAEEDLHSVG